MKLSTKILVMLMAGVLAFSGCAEDKTNSDSIETDVSTAESLTVTETTEKETEEVIPETKVFPDNAYNDIPEGYKDNITEKGTLEEFNYSAVNSFDEEYDKTAYVYLPFGYDPEDKETKYNVLYLMHGGGDTEYRYWGAGLQDVLDAMIEKGDCEPFIVVTPNYRIPGCDETMSAKTFYEELTNYLIPAFESEYNTYAEDTTPDGIKASRTHRAYGGFSMGACSVWAVFENCLDEIAYYMPVSGDTCMLSFTGIAKGRYFNGKIIGSGVDTQFISKSGQTVLSARYMLEGKDINGNECRCFIENNGSFEDGFIPKIITDSPALSEFEGAELKAEIAAKENGVIVSIYGMPL